MGPLLTVNQPLSSAGRGGWAHTPTLTTREREIAEMVADGSGNRDIARQFGISEETVKRHLSNVFDKTGMGTRTELAVWWLHRQHQAHISELKQQHAAELQALRKAA